MNTVWRRVYLDMTASHMFQRLCSISDAFNLNVLHFPSEHDNDI